ncbi:sulfite reductase subunit alpha [Zavarzinia sp. CC-PAN008]|uniref:sulfite reductase subunit alpha n=1 Tax=Zavarzinia sp. CC-PAN008 TaxID=3243332 RepID=UPI003F747B9B
MKLAWSAAILATYALFCVAVALRHRRMRGQPGDTVDDAGALLVAYASQTGDAEHLARETARALRAGGRAVRLLPLAAVTRPMLEAGGTALFVASTTGEGDAPDNAVPFVHRVMRPGAGLDRLDCAVLALGDRTYAGFCAFGLALAQWLEGEAARPLHPPVLVDRHDAAALARWSGQVAALGGVALDTAQAPFVPCRLRSRRVLNPGSPGAPAVLVELAPPPGLHWQAGDVAEVEVAPSVRRDYSIASLPADGVIQLLVRQVTRPDGRPGLGSHHLSQGAAPGTDIALRIRRNSPFHGPDGACPLILVGNGTGIAGLRAHLKERAGAGAAPTWLLFGERSPEHDRPFADELAAWQATGLLTHLDLAFSRGADPAYVQDVLAGQSARLRAWVAEGAVILVCGSLHGMADGVGRVLEDILGAEALDHLIVTGRYRRDVY